MLHELNCGGHRSQMGCNLIGHEFNHPNFLHMALHAMPTSYFNGLDLVWESNDGYFERCHLCYVFRWILLPQYPSFLQLFFLFLLMLTCLHNGETPMNSWKKGKSFGIHTSLHYIQTHFTLAIVLLIYLLFPMEFCRK